MACAILPRFNAGALLSVATDDGTGERQKNRSWAIWRALSAFLAGRQQDRPDDRLHHVGALIGRPFFFSAAWLGWGVLSSALV